MLVIPIKLWPFGDQSKEKVIGSLIIANDGTGNEEFGNYKISLIEVDRKGLRVQYAGVLKDWPRNQPVGKIVAAAMDCVNRSKPMVLDEDLQPVGRQDG